jgi:hypothetical protein
MSIDNPEIIDAVSVRDGFTIMTVFQLEPWPGESTSVGLLDEKLAHYLEHAQTSRHLALHARRPHVLELVCVESPPVAVISLCRRHGVVIRCRETRTDA